MSQCKAQTQSGTQCVANAAPPSKSLCGRHQKLLAGGTAVINFESGRDRDIARAGFSFRLVVTF